MSSQSAKLLPNFTHETSVADLSEFDEQVLDRAARGESAWRIAQALQTTEAEVSTALDRLARKINQRYRSHALVADLSLVHKAMVDAYDRYIDGSIEHGHLFARLSERHARLLGIDSASEVNLVVNQPRERSTAAIERGIRLLCAKRADSDPSVPP